jgi:anti-sigma regulatory factor (Ser/Thr protein kinase)
VAGLWVKHSASSAAVVRDSVFIGLTREGVSADDAYDATLLVSELVGNAVRHAPSLPSGHVAVRWEIHDDGCQLEVSDGGRSEHLDPVIAADSDTSGRGLAIVSALAERWGVKSNADSTTVWLFYRFSHQADQSEDLYEAS